MIELFLFPVGQYSWRLNLSQETAQLQHGGNTADNSPAIHSDMFSKALLQAR